jgi:hypothetical protein
MYLLESTSDSTCFMNTCFYCFMFHYHTDMFYILLVLWIYGTLNKLNWIELNHTLCFFKNQLIITLIPIHSSHKYFLSFSLSDKKFVWIFCLFHKVNMHCLAHPSWLINFRRYQGYFTPHWKMICKIKSISSSIHVIINASQVLMIIPC